MLMLKGSLGRLFQSATHNNLRLFSVHHEPVPSKLPKVAEIVVNIYVKNKYGVVETVPAFVGESLLDAISRMKVHAFEDNNCNGYDTTYRPHLRPHDNDTKGPICGGCRVVMRDNWFQRVHRETDGYNENEELILNSSVADLKSNTRLACCVPIEPWMEGLTCEVDIDPLEFREGILL